MKLYVDVREPPEFDQDHVKGALNIPLSRLMSGNAKLELLPKSAELVVYCRTGNRSEIALKILKNHGFDNVTNGLSQENIESTLLP